MVTPYASLHDVFHYADINDVSKLSDDPDNLDAVRVMAVVRRTGQPVIAYGRDVDEATENVLDEILENNWIIDDILYEHNLTFEELRQLVDFQKPIFEERSLRLREPEEHDFDSRFYDDAENSRDFDLSDEEWSDLFHGVSQDEEALVRAAQQDEAERLADAIAATEIDPLDAAVAEVAAVAAADAEVQPVVATAAQSLEAETESQPVRFYVYDGEALWLMTRVLPK